MVVFPNAKINIGLKIVGKRQDGYHNLETIFYPIKLKDALEIIERPTQTKEEVVFSQSGLKIDTPSSQNICLKAFHLLRKDHPQIPAVAIHLHKYIPMGAGMGGGSADGAAMIELLNARFQLQLSTHQKIDYALQLGSDCPFFIHNQPCFASGRGDILEPIIFTLKGFQILIVYPGIHISTAQAFSNIQIDPTPSLLKTRVQEPIEQWKHTIFNAFEGPVFAAYPAIQQLKALLYENGAVYASMSGSGSTVYGIFPAEVKPSFNFPAGYFHKWV